MLDRELKKRSAELIILSIVETRARHGYEISQQIETRSAGQLKFHIASLYPLLYRLEERGWLQGRWVEKTGQRRRRFYRLTAEGRRVLASQRDTWKSFVAAMRLITGVDNALIERPRPDHLIPRRQVSGRPRCGCAWRL